MINNNPEVDIIWDDKGWRRSHRRYMRPYVESAINLASDAVQSIGINYNNPKSASIRRCGNSYPAIGENQDDSGFRLFIRVDDYRRRNANKRFGQYVVASAHELTHAARHERYSEWDLLEEVASEGIAHVAEDFVTLDIGITNKPLYTEVINTQKINYQVIKNALMSDYEKYGNSDSNIDKWFDWDSPYMDEAVVIGIAEVQNRLIEGHSISEIIEWPPERVLDLS